MHPQCSPNRWVLCVKFLGASRPKNDGAGSRFDHVINTIGNWQNVVVRKDLFRSFSGAWGDSVPSGTPPVGAGLPRGWTAPYLLRSTASSSTINAGVFAKNSSNSILPLSTLLRRALWAK